MEVAIPIAIVVVIALLVVVAVMTYARRKSDRAQELRTAARTTDLEMLRYRVPEGRDPAVLLAALRREGFEAIPDSEDVARHDILIPCHEGKDRHREHVRAVIENVDQVNLDGDRDPVGAVRFTDE